MMRTSEAASEIVRSVFRNKFDRTASGRILYHSFVYNVSRFCGDEMMDEYFWSNFENNVPEILSQLHIKNKTRNIDDL